MSKTWYSLAHNIWQSAKWIWTVIIIAILVSVASSVFTGKNEELSKTTVFIFINWLRAPGFYQVLIFSFFGLFIVISLVTGLTVFIQSKNKEATYTLPEEVRALLNYLEKDMKATKEREDIQQALGKAAFMHYLRSIEILCETISPRGFAQLSRTLTFIDMPLEAIFTHLHIVSDEPIYDAPGEQLRQREAIRMRTDLSSEERDAYLQGLHIIWQSQLRQDVDEKQAQQPFLLEKLLLQLTPTNTVAILLGVPGSGKTTFLRWLALHMARATLSSNINSLPGGMGHPQIPILIQTKEYADRLEKDYLTLKQFLIIQWSAIHPNLAQKLLDELAQGHCLVLFDGMDQGGTVSGRRHVIAAIYEFIADYSSGDSNNYNRFIIASRITDSEPGALTKYSHYTLLDLDEQQVEQIVANWCLSIARYWASADKGMQPLTQQEEAKARSVGAKQQERISRLLKDNDDLMQLAANPMALTMIVLLHLGGRNLLQHRFELCQMFTRTLLDTWNRESGHKMFSGEEMPLAEQLLCNLAIRLQESGTLLSKFDVMTTTRQTLATFQQLQPVEIKEHDIVQFIETLRRSSGLFVEGGENLYYFANRTIQDYYVILSLLHLSQDELAQFAFQRYRSALWREPLQFALRYKSRQLLLTVRPRQLDESRLSMGSPTHPLALTPPEERTRSLQGFNQVRHLTKQQVEELLAACIDIRPLPEATQQTLGIRTVQEMAWNLLRQSFVLPHEALNAVWRALESSKAPICEGAAILLQRCATLSQESQQQAAQKILLILIDSNITHHFSPLSYFELRRLYDILFETLDILSTQS